MAYYGKRQWLRKIRTDKGLSQDMVAVLAEISQTYYSKIEVGYIDPTPETVEKISKVLDISTDDFYKHDEKRISGQED